MSLREAATGYAAHVDGRYVNCSQPSSVQSELCFASDTWSSKFPQQLKIV